MASDCDIGSGVLRGCKSNLGGLSDIILYNFVPNSLTVADGVATAINPLVTVAYRYEIEGDVNNLEQAFVPSRDNGTSVNTETITAILTEMIAATSNELKFLVYGKTVAVIKDRNGKYVACGLFDGVDFSVTATTGSAMADLNGYTLTGVSTGNEFAAELDSATVTALLALVA